MANDEQLFECLSKCASQKTIIVGIGNTLKADDGVGPAICERIRSVIPVDVIDTGTVPENYIQHIKNKRSRNIIIIDAIDFAGVPGSIKIFSPDQLDTMMLSTHILSPKFFVDMITADNDTEVIVIGIQPASTELAKPLSVDVEQAVQRLAEILKKALAVTKTGSRY
ncbi:MAG: hydrogenase maturation protease [Anaerohalosphaera sp.]|nr:hydrogenase maturation protease [Anaerohalosphaera sp.]